jgi:transglutaminase-like putative cysteine protease
MARLARDGAKLPEVVRLAQRLQTWNDAGKTIRTIEGFIRSRFRYRSEEIETLRTVEKMLETLRHTGKIYGDCDDICILIASLLLACGLKPRFVAIQTDVSTDDYLHVFVTILGQIIDVTVMPKTTLIAYGEPMEMAI